MCLPSYGFIHTVLSSRSYPHGLSSKTLNSPLELKISALCARLVATDDAREYVCLNSELREALKEHMERLRIQTLAYPPDEKGRSS